MVFKNLNNQINAYCRTFVQGKIPIHTSQNRDSLTSLLHMVDLTDLSARFFGKRSAQKNKSDLTNEHLSTAMFRIAVLSQTERKTDGDFVFGNGRKGKVTEINNVRFHKYSSSNVEATLQKLISDPCFQCSVDAFVLAWKSAQATAPPKASTTSRDGDVQLTPDKLTARIAQLSPDDKAKFMQLLGSA
jgi:hypothetical protein